MEVARGAGARSAPRACRRHSRPRHDPFDRALLGIHFYAAKDAFLATPATTGKGIGATHHGHGDLRAITLAAIGVVYGDIGTSPLYTMREAFGHAGGLHLSEPAVLGVLSLVFWSLILIVTREVRRADPARRQPRRGRRAGAGHAGLPRRARHARSLPADPRPDDRRPGAVLRRRPDHARDLGALGGGGPGDRGTRARALRRADRRRRAARPVSAPEPRHGQRRQALRAR